MEIALSSKLNLPVAPTADDPPAPNGKLDEDHEAPKHPPAEEEQRWEHFKYASIYSFWLWSLSSCAKIYIVLVYL
jgi:hypothetical protein